MWPGASVSGWYFSHPESQYFVVGRLGRDQVADYAERKGWTLPEAERWLSANRLRPRGLTWRRRATSRETGCPQACSGTWTARSSTPSRTGS